MKTKQIEMSLNDIKEEDQISLSVKKNENQKLELEIADKENEIEKYKKDLEKIEYLKEINKNDFKYFHIIAPLVEIPAIALFLTAPIFQGLTISNTLMSGFVILACTVDMAYVNSKYYQRLSNKNNFFKNMIESIKQTTKSERKINKEIVRAEVRLMCSEEDFTRISNEIKKNKQEIDILEDELSYIDGALIGVTTMSEKYKIEDVPEDNEVVEYVNKNKVLTRRDA